MGLAPFPLSLHHFKKSVPPWPTIPAKENPMFFPRSPFIFIGLIAALALCPSTAPEAQNQAALQATTYIAPPIGTKLGSNGRFTLGPRPWAPSGCLFYRDSLSDSNFNVSGQAFARYQGTASRVFLALEQDPQKPVCPSKSPSGTPIVPLAFPMTEVNDTYTFTLPTGRTCTGHLTPNGFTNGLSCRG